MKTATLGSFVFFLFTAFPAMSQSTDIQRVRFASKIDGFILEYKDGGFFLGAKSVPKESQTSFTKYLEVQGFGDCPTLTAKPDLEIMVERSNVKRPDEYDFFVSDSILRKNDQCLSFPLYALTDLPLNRDWFVGSNLGGITLSQTISLKTEDQRVYVLKRNKSGWEGAPGDFPNLEFLNPLLASLEKFEITKRLHPFVKQDSPCLLIQSGEEKTSFCLSRLGEWTLSKRGYLISSKSWKFWGEVAEKAVDPDEASLKKVLDPTLSEAERVAALRALGSRWSSNIASTYATVFQDETVTNPIRELVGERLVQRPTPENLKILLKTLLKTPDLRIRAFLSERMRIYNKNGPVLSDSELNVQKKLEAWSRWGRSKGYLTP